MSAIERHRDLVLGLLRVRYYELAGTARWLREKGRDDASWQATSDAIAEVIAELERESTRKEQGR